MRTKPRLSTVLLLIGFTAIVSLASCGQQTDQQKILEDAGIVRPARGSPEAAAQAAFEVWAQRVRMPYKNEHFRLLNSDGTFASVRVVAEFRETAASDWLEKEATLECRKVGGEWQSDTWMYFELTQAAQARLRTVAAATATAQQAVYEATTTAAAQLRAAAATPIPPVGKQRHLTVGDRMVYEVYSEGYVGRTTGQVVGEEIVGERLCWVVVATGSLTTTGSDAIPTMAFSSTTWVDQETGVATRYESQRVNASPQPARSGGQAFEEVESRFTRTYDLDQGTMEQVGVRIGTAGEQYEEHASYPANYDIFLITRDLHMDEWYPWRTTEYSAQVIAEQTISVPAGSFDCWTIKKIQGEGQYYLLHYDKVTGMGVKHENWANHNGEWEKLDETVMISFHPGWWGSRSHRIAVDWVSPLVARKSPIAYLIRGLFCTC